MGRYEVTVEKTGYYSTTVELGKTDADTEVKIELSSQGKHRFRFYVLYPRCDCGGSGKRVLRPANPGLATTAGLMPMVFQTADDIEPVVGAKARLLDPVTMDIVAEATSDANGLVDFGEVSGGTYILQIISDEFEDYSTTVDLLVDLELNFVVGPEDDDITNPGNGDDNGNGDGTTPGDGDDDGNGDGTTPGNGDDNGNGDGTTPGDGDDNGNGDGTTPGNGNGDGNGDGTTPGDGDDNGNVDGTTPGNGDDNDSDDSTNPGGNEPGTDGDVTSESGDEATSSGGPNSSQMVNQLPNTGTGDSDSHVGIAALTFVMVFGLLSALGVRRKS